MKRVVNIFFCLLLCGMLSSCGESNDTASSPAFTYSMNFFQEEFEAEYSHYEKALQVSEDSSEIKISGQTSSGKIDIEIICTDNNDTKTYKFEINGVTDEKIALSDEHPLVWSALVDCYKDTDGTFTITVE